MRRSLSVSLPAALPAKYTVYRRRHQGPDQLEPLDEASGALSTKASWSCKMDLRPAREVAKTN